MEGGIQPSHFTTVKIQAMRLPIRYQILVPFAVVLVAALAAITVTSSWLAVRRSARATLERLRGVVETLETATFPFSRNVLEQMRGLTGAHFVSLDSNGELIASTVALDSFEPLRSVPTATDLSNLLECPLITVSGDGYFAAQLQVTRPRSAGSLIVLYPVRNWRTERWNAAWPPLAVGMATLLVMAAVATMLANRLGRRIHALSRLLNDIAAGSFKSLPVGKGRDELDELFRAANDLSDRLRSMEQTIRQTERVRLLAQIAGGLAHQLRNDVTGVRMAIELHGRRCPARAGDETLAVALRQLSVTEEHLRSFLASARDEGPGRTAPARLAELLREIVRLLKPTIEHAHVAFELKADAAHGEAMVTRPELVRMAVVNLVLNALEAAGPGGQVELSLERRGAWLTLHVVDNGPGPPEQLGERICEPFVSSKPHGVGLGLAIARRVAEQLDGELTWKRHNDRTVFTLRWPDAGPAPAFAQP